MDQSKSNTADIDLKCSSMKCSFI